MRELCPSILAADFNILGEQLSSLERAHVTWLHIDVMDGMFVPSISFGNPVIASIRSHKSFYFDTHLMVMRPLEQVENMKKCGADALTFHLESDSDPYETISKIKGMGMKAGLSIKPATPVEDLSPFLGLVDLVLIMTVEPGAGGQAYIPESTERIRRARQLLDEAGSKACIQVDGGIKDETLPLALGAGAEKIVAGSWVFKGDVYENACHIEQMIRNSKCMH